MDVDAFYVGCELREAIDAVFGGFPERVRQLHVYLPYLRNVVVPLIGCQPLLAHRDEPVGRDAIASICLGVLVRAWCELGDLDQLLELGELVLGDASFERSRRDPRGGG